jgi:hypothetical protein
MGAAFAKNLSKLSSAQAQARPPPIVVAPPRAQPNVSPTQCQVKKISYNSTVNEAAKLKKIVDNCDPVEAKKKRREETTTRLKAWKTKTEYEFNLENSALTDNIGTADKLQASLTPLQEYHEELKKKKESLEFKNEKLEQNQRANRRRFLDNSPQEQTTNFFKIQTNDDKVMLFFWITLFFLIFCSTFIFTSMYGKHLGITTDNQKLMFDIVIIAVLFGISWYSVTYFA